MASIGSPQKAAPGTRQRRHHPHDHRLRGLRPVRTGQRARTVDESGADRRAMAYTETDVIDVAGTLVVPPLQWYLPGPESSLLYLTRRGWWRARSWAAVRGFLLGGGVDAAGRASVREQRPAGCGVPHLVLVGNHCGGRLHRGRPASLFGNGGFGVAIISRSDGTWTTAGPTWTSPSPAAPKAIGMTGSTTPSAERSGSANPIRTVTHGAGPGAQPPARRTDAPRRR